VKHAYLNGLGAQFVDAEGDDYHLKSEGWRWAGDEAWMWDDVSSPCIDSGNPGTPLGDEPESIERDPDNVWGVNIRVNMGAYGGTSQASMGPHGWAMLADLNNDGIVDWLDVGLYAQCWLSADYEPAGDLNRDGTVDMSDWALLGQDWSQQTIWR
ncbi:MAG: dockerin type I domain-containing protein, partial [Planctomycetota bacterium]